MRWAECFLILAANLCWASTGSPAYEKAFLFSLGAIWSALDWLWSSPEESLNSSVFWTLQGGSLAEGRKVSICCSFCNFNRVGKASFVTSVPVNKLTIVILLNWVWKIMRKCQSFVLFALWVVQETCSILSSNQAKIRSLTGHPRFPALQVESDWLLV